MSLKQAMKDHEEATKDGIHITFTQEDEERLGTQTQIHNVSGLQVLSAINVLLMKAEEETGMPRPLILMMIDSTFSKTRRDEEEED